MSQVIKIIFIIILGCLVACSSWWKKKSPPLKGVWLETKLSSACQNLVENRVKFNELMCGSWNDISFYMESFFHVQAINFKKAGEKEFLFKGKGEIAGGKCFLGISAYVTGNNIQILADETKKQAQAILFELAAIDVDTNDDTKGFCSVKYDKKAKKWCAIGMWKDLKEAKMITERNPSCDK